MMTDLYLIATIVVAAMLAFPLWRIVRGPTIFDRLLGAAMMGTKTIVLLLLMGKAGGRLDMFVDISLGYGPALLAGTLVAAKYLEDVASREREERNPQGASEVTDGGGGS